MAVEIILLVFMLISVLLALKTSHKTIIINCITMVIVAILAWALLSDFTNIVLNYFNYSALSTSIIVFLCVALALFLFINKLLLSYFPDDGLEVLFVHRAVLAFLGMLRGIVLAGCIYFLIPILDITTPLGSKHSLVYSIVRESVTVQKTLIVSEINENVWFVENYNEQRDYSTLHKLATERAMQEAHKTLAEATGASANLSVGIILDKSDINANDKIQLRVEKLAAQKGFIAIDPQHFQIILIPVASEG